VGKKITQASPASTGLRLNQNH